jgi:hypothetical protein
MVILLEGEGIPLILLGPLAHFSCSPRKESARVPKPPKQQPEILQEEEGPDTPTKAPTPTQEQPKYFLKSPNGIH